MVAAQPIPRLYENTTIASASDKHSTSTRCRCCCRCSTVYHLQLFHLESACAHFILLCHNLINFKLLNFLLMLSSVSFRRCKGTATFGLFQKIRRNLLRVVATGHYRGDKVGAGGKILSFKFSGIIKHSGESAFPRMLVLCMYAAAYCFSRLSFCLGARALVVFSVYSAIFSWAVAAMSRLLVPMQKV